MTRLLAVGLTAQGLDLVTFVAAITLLGVPIRLESNPLYVSTYLAGGLLAISTLKLSLTVVMLYLVGRLDRHRAVGIGLACLFGLVGAASNVWTSLVFLQFRAGA